MSGDNTLQTCIRLTRMLVLPDLDIPVCVYTNLDFYFPLSLARRAQRCLVRHGKRIQR